MPERRAPIDRAGIAQPRLRFLWDEWQVSAHYTDIDEVLLARVTPLCPRAQRALTIAIAEWIVYRFEGLDPDPDPLLFLEAAWAANLDTRYAHDIEIDDADWGGPVRGPLSMALTFVADALFAEEADDQPAMNPCWAARFARHVLPDTRSFDPWLDAVVDRLVPLYPALPEAARDWFDPSRNLGPPVPPDVFDTTVPFDPARTDEHLARFLAMLDPRSNPFLCTPAEMRADGFAGRPYRWPA